MQTIVFATDFSKANVKALQRSISLAKLSKSKLILLHVFEYNSNKYDFTPPKQQDIKDQSEQAQAVLDDMVMKCEEYHLNLQSVMLSGYPPKQIVEFVNNHNVDLLVIGRHGYTAWEHKFMGTTADYITRRVNCGVMVVHSQALCQIPKNEQHI